MSQTETESEFDEIISIELENDELVRLVTSNADVASQYVIFQNYKDEYYAINVAKVEELIEYKTLDITATSDSLSFIKGTAKIRDNFVNIVCFDTWLKAESADESVYELAILCNYAGVRLAIIVKSVYGVLNIEPSQMYDDSDKDEKVSYICELIIDSQKVLCKVFDSDKFLIDVLPNKFTREMEKSEHINVDKNNIITKEIFVAEDSMIIQNSIASLLNKMELKYRLFSNGKKLLDAMESTNLDDIGLIITDLEMPVMGGLELLDICSKNDLYKNIPIIVNTNMSNSGIINSAQKLGVKKVIKKLDLLTLREAILEFSNR